MLTTLKFSFLYYKAQFCFRQHLHCITFKCHKRLTNINRSIIPIVLDKHQNINSLYFECVLHVSKSLVITKKST